MKSALSCFLFAFILYACSSKDFGKEVRDKGHTLYYVEPVTEQEARNVLNWLHETNHNFSEPALPFQLKRERDKYIFNYPVNIKDAENEPGNISFMQGFANHLSARLGKPVDVALTNEDLTVIKKVISSNGKE